MTSRRSSGSSRAASSVEPTRSQNITVSWRRSASVGAGASEGAAVTAAVGTAAPSAAMASSSLRRWPIAATPILAHAATAHKFERELYVRKADRHRATSEYLIKDVDRAPGIRGQPGSAHGKTCPCDRQNPVLATGPVS